MDIPKIDKEIMEKYFGGEKFEPTRVSPRKSIRTYDINDGAVTLLVGTPRTIEHIGELAVKLISKAGMSVFMTTYKHFVVCVIFIEELYKEALRKDAKLKSTS